MHAAAERSDDDEAGKQGRRHATLPAEFLAEADDLVGILGLERKTVDALQTFGRLIDECALLKGKRRLLAIDQEAVAKMENGTPVIEPDSSASYTRGVEYTDLPAGYHKPVGSVLPLHDTFGTDEPAALPVVRDRRHGHERVAGM